MSRTKDRYQKFPTTINIGNHHHAAKDKMRCFLLVFKTVFYIDFNTYNWITSILRRDYSVTSVLQRL